ncbi:uncharacterized protein HMPREF1541_06708 [Cyphellophora europaea CBS 101466]|uniref:Uncharacterized protein n=1 Tax=Cyphellophora europaea (strain CBS 101466) TaxID=1220924 RepID=W2RQ64_CYPE1|nr:uncharacterized protein HMPREF1541_06708 [Cyphellophora europaea CBS 101466]ETN38671.1 hypothetical protein HMPREF1541_06708 [Cyphellophora europaea CBS 101466]
MPWFWWAGQSNHEDPTKSLDPSLKEFLKEQQPRPYVPAEPPQKIDEPQQDSQPEVALPDTNKTYEDRPVPPESLYQDGRYAHIWKTYTPQTQIAATTSTAVDRINQAKKDRKREIHRASLENCAFEEEIRQECLNGQNVTSRFRATMTMCNEETKQYTRCYQLQSKFLQALGYMSGLDSDAEHEERIQMHADKLYHRMMDYEAEVEDAKRNHKPIPPLTSVFDPKRPAPTIEQMDVPVAVQARMDAPLHELPPHERELAARAALQEAKIKTSDTAEYQKFAHTMNDERKQRQSKIAKIMGEPIAKWFIPDPEILDKRFDESMKDLRFDRDIWRDDVSPAGSKGSKG